MKENFPKKSRTITDDKEKEHSIEHCKNLNSFIEQVTMNIQNLDNMLSSGHGKKNRPSILEPDRNDIQNIVKQSVDGLGDIFKMNSSRGMNLQGSTKNVGKTSFEIIEEEQVGGSIKEPKCLIANSKRMKLNEGSGTNVVPAKAKKNGLIVNTNLSTKTSQKVINSTRNKNEASNGDSGKAGSNALLISKFMGNKKEVVKQEKKPNTASHNVRTKSTNKRYEHEEREVSVNRDRKSRSPVPPMKSYQLKPRKTLQNDLLNSSHNNNSFLGNKEIVKPNDYVSSDTKIIKLEIKNFFNNDAKTSRSVHHENPFSNSFDKSLSHIGEHTPKLEEKPEQPHIEKIQNYINLSLLFNEYYSDNIKDFNNKLISQDMSKLLTSLYDDAEKEEVVLGFENSAINKIKNGLKNKRDEKKYNSKILDIAKITNIQRQWRRHITNKMLKTNDRERLCSDMKKNVISSLIHNEPFKKVMSGLNSLLGQFNNLVKDNKSISLLTNRYIRLGECIHDPK
jgi:hypothetical protein